MWSTQHLELFFFCAYPGILVLWLQTIKHDNSMGMTSSILWQKQLFPSHFKAHAEKSIICKVHWDKQRWLLVASQSGTQSSHACLITRSWMDQYHTYDLFMAHQLGNGYTWFIPIPSWVSDTFKRSHLHLAMYHQNLQAVEIITQINEVCLAFTEKQERGPKFKGAKEGSFGGTNSVPSP